MTRTSTPVLSKLTVEATKFSHNAVRAVLDFHGWPQEVNATIHRGRVTYTKRTKGEAKPAPVVAPAPAIDWTALVARVVAGERCVDVAHSAGVDGRTLLSKFRMADPKARAAHAAAISKGRRAKVARDKAALRAAYPGRRYNNGASA